MRTPFFLVSALLFALGASTPWTQGQELTPPGVEVGVENLAEEEDHAEEGWSAVAFRWVNFLILFGGLGYLLRQPAVEFFKTRTGLIQGGLERSRAAQRDSEGRLNDIELRLSRVSAEADGIRSEANRSARTERERIVKDAQAEAGRAVDQSATEVDRIAQAMSQSVRAEVADLLISKAEDRLRRKMTDRDRARSVRKAVDKL